jgi:hypothetical protein
MEATHAQQGKDDPGGLAILLMACGVYCSSHQVLAKATFVEVPLLFSALLFCEPVTR